MVYPQTMETSDCNLTFDTPAQMVEAACSFRTFLSTMGATDYHRICDMADISEDGTEISGEHTTYIIRGGQFAVEPYRNRCGCGSTVRRLARRWASRRLF
jgi:hypothetical protein